MPFERYCTAAATHPAQQHPCLHCITPLNLFNAWNSLCNTRHMELSAATPTRQRNHTLILCIQSNVHHHTCYGYGYACSSTRHRNTNHRSAHCSGCLPTTASLCNKTVQGTKNREPLHLRSFPAPAGGACCGASVGASLLGRLLFSFTGLHLVEVGLPPLCLQLGRLALHHLPLHSACHVT